jgi:hypothetical protein
VGAQLLQRLDVVRVNRDHAPQVPVRWGVPIAPGSGGRRRRPEAGGGAPVGFEGAQLGRHRDGPSAVASGEAIVAQLGPDAAAQQVDAHGGTPGRSAEVNETAGGVAVASAASGGEARPSSGDTALAVEGLGLADLLAGALAAYRAI